MLIEVLTHFSIGSITVGIGSGVLACVYYRAELKRAVRIARAEIGDRLKPKKHLSIEMAMHLDAEVDMKWWDEEFAKIEKSIPAPGWTNMVPSRLIEPTAAEVNRLAAAGVTSVQDGEFIFNIASMSASLGLLTEAEQREKILAEMQEYEASRSALEAAKEASIKAMQESPNVSKIPRDISTRLRANIDNAETTEELAHAAQEAFRAIVHYTAQEECEFCEYVEHRTYTSQYAERRRVRLCWQCEADKNGFYGLAESMSNSVAHSM